MAVDWPFVWFEMALPSLALGLSFFLWRDRAYHLPVVTLWMVIVSQIFVIVLVGGQEQLRYVLPIEPLYVILIVAGFSTILSTIKRGTTQKGFGDCVITPRNSTIETRSDLE